MSTLIQIELLVCADICVDNTTVQELIKDIEKYGLKHPLKVMKCGDKYFVQDGRHRLKALLALKWTIIPCDVIGTVPKQQHPHP